MANRKRHMIDLKELESALKTMQPRQAMYELIKAELKRRGHWKNLKRGRPTITKKG